MCGIAQNNSKIAHWMFTSTESQSYSNDYPYKNYSNFIDTYQGLNSRKNIIIVVVESLSSYMSKHFYPVHGLGYTPFLDSLAENTIEFRNYSCTAFNSSENMYSLISGYPYIHNNVTDEKLRNSDSPEEINYHSTEDLEVHISSTILLMFSEQKDIKLKFSMEEI